MTDVTTSLLSLLIEIAESISRLSPDVVCTKVRLDTAVLPEEKASTRGAITGGGVDVSMGVIDGVYVGLGVDGSVAVDVNVAVAVGVSVGVGV